MDSIFNQQERNALIKSGAGLQRIEDKVDTARKRGLKEAFERIKGDHETHDSLANLFGDAEGFVLKFHHGAYLGDFERGSWGQVRDTSGEEPPYLSFKNNTTQYNNLLLLAQRNRDNHVFFGDWYDIRVHGEGVQSVVRIYVPDINVQKILHRIGANLLTEPENFALAWLSSRGEVGLSIRDGQDLPQGRQWERNYGHDYDSSRREFKAKLGGEDLIEFYKESVRGAAEWTQNLERFSGHAWGTPSFGNLVANSQNAKFLNRNRYPIKNIPTKIYGFELRQMHI